MIKSKVLVVREEKGVPLASWFLLQAGENGDHNDFVDFLKGEMKGE